MPLYYFDDEWKQYIKGEGERPENTIYLDGKLKEKLDHAKQIQIKEWDCVMLIDGLEGSGKSTLSFIIGWYLSNGQLNMQSIAEGSEDAVNKLAKLPDKSILIIDEGSLAFSSTDVMKKEQRRLIKILNVIRQKRMFLIIVAPSFFNLNKYISIERSRFLLHVYTKGGERGYFTYFGEKKKRILYERGKKNFNSYSYPTCKFRGRFTKFDPFGEEYQQLKTKSLLKAIEGEKKKVVIKPQMRAEIIKNFVINNPDLKQKEIADRFGVTSKTIQNIMSKFLPNTPISYGK